MAEAVNVLKMNELDAFHAWAAENDYEYDDMLAFGWEAFRLIKPGAGDVIFYKVAHIGCLATYSDAGIKLLNEWRKSDLDFLM
jgi:hypothetical protein